MDGQTAADMQRDDQAAATTSAGVQAHIDSSLRDLHTCMPGIIKSYDPGTQTATVQPVFKTVFVDEPEPIDLPLCMDVPVVFPEGGNFVLTFPVSPGDECLLFFSERAIDFWWDRGGVQLPSEVRFHDLSDGFALVGVRSRPRFLENVATDAAELRTRDGTVVLRIEGDKIVLDAATVHVGGAAGSQPATLGQTLQTYLNLIATHIHTGVTTGGGVSGTSAELATAPNVLAERARVK